MKILIIVIVLGPLLIIGAPTTASQSSLSFSGASVRLAAARDSTADRETYLQKARDEMLEWKRKLHAFEENVHTEAAQAHSTAGDDLNKAWAETEAASLRLETAGSEDWEATKASFRRASNRLDLAWRKFDPGRK